MPFKKSHPDEFKGKSYLVKYSRNDVIKHGSLKNLQKAILDARDGKNLDNQKPIK